MGPFGGSAAVVAVDDNHSGTVIAASSNGLLFKTRNHGESWTPVSFPGQLRTTLHAFAIDSAHGSTYYAGVSSDSAELAGLYRSTDEGATWEQVPGLKKIDIWSIAFSPSDPNVIAAGAREGIYLSNNAGNTWRRISPPENRELAPVVSLAFDPRTTTGLYAGTPHLPWKTADGGATWHPVHEGMLDDSDVFSIHIDVSQPQLVFASACSGIYRSQNAGALWSKMKGAEGASYRTYFVTQDPTKPNTVFAGTTFGAAKSTDGGETWHQISKEATHWIAFDSKNPGRMYFATDEAGMLRSDDGGETIHAINNGFCNRQLPALTSAGDSVLTASIYEPVKGGVFQLRSGAKAWERIAPSSEIPAQLLRLEAVPDGKEASIFALSYDSMLLSQDGGRKWSNAPALGGKLKATAFIGNGSTSQLVAGTETGLYRHEANAKSWTRVEGPFGKEKIKVVARIGSAGMAVATPSAIFVSSDGEAWKTTAPMPGERSINNIVSAGDRRLIAGTTAGLIRSDDFGASWEPVRWGLGGSSVSAVCQHPSRPQVVFAAQYGVVYQSSDAGETWTRVSPDRNSTSFQGDYIQLETIKGLAVLPGAPDRLLALTQNQGTFALLLPTSTVGATQATSASSSSNRSTSNTGRIGKFTTAR